jgi:hypothetical protein
MSRVFIYVVDRDFGFAPNPYHGMCTLATCKPAIRRVSKKEDWIIGMGGNRLKATGKIVYGMQVSEKITFNEYWNNPIYNDKKPVRNGTKRMVVGDNIYHHDNNNWEQADSHHSNHDGTVNKSNLDNDTQTDNVLISRNFYYFGIDAPEVPLDILKGINYKNGIGHRNYSLEDCTNLITWLKSNFEDFLNLVKSKPFDFENHSARYSAGTNKITLNS